MSPSKHNRLPPLISIVSPVIKPSYSEARKATARATSYGFPDRPSGMDAMVFNADSFVV